MTINIKDQPRYVAVYNKIYDRINDGTYPIGSKLPGENELARTFKVSRGTLRQALLILNENGLIKNEQGKGNFVLNNSGSIEVGLEKLSCIPKHFSNEDLEGRLINVLYEPPSNYSQKMMKIGPNDLIMVMHRDFSKDDKVCAYTLCMIPITILNEYNMDLNDNSMLMEFAEEAIFQICSRSESKIIVTKAGQFLNKVMDVPVDTTILTIEEYFYDSSGRIIGSHRHSTLPEYFTFNIIRT